MDKNRRRLLGGLGVALFGAATGHAAPGLLASSAHASTPPMTFVLSGGNKGVGPILPNLLNFKGSIVVLDVKGENPTVAGDRNEGPFDD